MIIQDLYSLPTRQPIIKKIKKIIMWPLSPAIAAITRNGIAITNFFVNIFTFMSSSLLKNNISEIYYTLKAIFSTNSTEIPEIIKNG